MWLRKACARNGWVTADGMRTVRVKLAGGGYGHAMKDNSIKVMNMFVSIYLLTMLSVDRYISIVRASFKTSLQKWTV